MQETSLRPSTSYGPTARGFCGFLEDLFPTSTPYARFAFAVKTFLAHDPPPFDAASLIAHSREIGIGLSGEPEMATTSAITRLNEYKKSFAVKPASRVALENAIYWTTELRVEQIRSALDATEIMEKDIEMDPRRVGHQAFKQAMRALFGTLFGEAQKADEKPAEKMTVVEASPSMANRTVTFDRSGHPTIHPAKVDEAKPLQDRTVSIGLKINGADVVKATEMNDYTPESIKASAADVATCATAIHNTLLVQGRTRLGLSEVHDRMKALGHAKPTVLAAIDDLTRTGKAFMDGHALVPSTMLPTSLNGWGPEIIELNRSKGWYDEEQLSDTATKALAKLSADERTELLKYMPLIPHREAKGRIDVSTFCTNLTGEVSELWEAYRKGELDKPCDKAAKMKTLGLPELTCAEEEMADIVIRTLDTAEFWGMDIQRAVLVKYLLNASRSHRHGGKLA